MALAQPDVVVDRAAAMIAGMVPVADWLVILPVAVPIAVGALLMTIRHRMRWHAAIALLGIAATLAATLLLLARVTRDGPATMTMGSWLPPYGIAFTADTLGASMAAMASFVTLACGIFSLVDISTSGRRYGFYPFLMLLLAGVNGAFLTGDIFNLYVWFEVFIIASFGLLVLGSERAQLDGATKYAILNLVGTTLFLVTTAYLYGTFGTLNMADLALRIRQSGEAEPLLTIASLFMLAFGMKAAAFPLNFWLPAAYHTPRIVAAALFGGLLTKVGIYALLRILLMLMPDERAMIAPVIGWLAATTMVLGALGALAQSDLRRLVGFLVVGGVGVMLAGLAIGSAVAVAGSIFYALQSMLVMAGLYLLCAMVREAAGNLSLHQLGGLWRARPWLAAMALLLVLAGSGLPGGPGLWPKVLLVRASLDAAHWWLAAAILTSSLLTTIVLFRVFLLAFWRPSPPGEGERDAAPAVRPGMAALTLLCVPIALLGLLPETVARLSLAGAGGVLDPAAYIGAVFPGQVLP